MAVKLLIADDERLFRQSLKILLETAKDLKVVAEAADGQEAVVKVREAAPDMVLLDVDMPRMDGIKAAKLIAALAPQTKILMLSVHGDDAKVASSIAAGAIGYVLKDTDRDDLIAIIRHAHAGRVHASPYLAHLTLNSSAKRNGSEHHVPDEPLRTKYGLSALELKILYLMSEGLNNDEISQLTKLSRETVKGYLKNLFRKLQVRNRTEAAVLAVRERISQIPNGASPQPPVRGH